MMIPFVHSVLCRFRSPVLTRPCAKLLTLFLISSLTSCAYLKDRTLEQCKTHAYVESVLEDYLSRRYHSGAPVRIGIIPLTVPANLTQRTYQYRGLGNELAYQLQAHFLNRETVPIVEVLNREDWPAKKDEFYTGNYGALSQAREAGYDLILVGIVDNYNPYAEIVASTKIIEVESGITLWYGKTTAHTMRRDYRRGADYLGLEERRPAETFATVLEPLLTKCISNEIHSRNRQQ